MHTAVTSNMKRMTRIRPDVASIKTYDEGPGVGEIAVRFGRRDIVQLSYNENPLPPFPEVQEVITAAAAGLNRYPDRLSVGLIEALSAALDVPGESLWLGAGSSQLLTSTARALGGRGSSIVYPWPSFSMYPVNASLAAAEGIEAALDEAHGVDLKALGQAIRDDTTLVYLCNPNNPTGTYVPQSAIRGFVDRVPEDILVVVDEAYGEYVAAEDHPTALPLALERPNVTVARTFSKMYGLAGLRVGYMIGRPDTLRLLRKVQIPFVINSLAQTAAATALAFPERVAARFEMNRQGVTYLQAALEARGIEFVPTQANFIWTRLGPDTPSVIQALLERGTMIRLLADEWARVTIGTPEENRRFITDLDSVRASI